MKVQFQSIWHLARFDEIMTRVNRRFIIDDLAEYDCVGVRWYGLGAFIRERQLGASINRKQQWMLRQGDVVYNKLFAWKGAFAIADESVDGCIVSDKFPTYELDQSQVDPSYLAYFFRTPHVASQSEGMSKGGAAISKFTLNPPQFWDLVIPLPPLDEQRRIVAHIDALAARIAEARGLRLGAVEEAEAFLVSVRRHVFTSLTNAPVVHFETACNAIIDNLHSNPTYTDDGIYPCIRSSDVGWGELFLETARRTDEAEYLRRTVRGAPQVDDIVLVREGGGTGKAAAVSEGQVFSLGQRVMMVRPNQQQVLPRFMLNQMLSPLIYDDQILPQSKGSASPHLNISALRKFRFVLPPLDEQRRIVAYLDDLQARVDALRRLQQETAAELDALLPSVLDRAFKGEL